MALSDISSAVITSEFRLQSYFHANQTRFETEAQENLEIAYWCWSFNAKIPKQLNLY